MTRTEIEEEKARGRQAYREGKDASANPNGHTEFSEDMDRYHIWSAGWWEERTREERDLRSLGRMPEDPPEGMNQNLNSLRLKEETPQ